MRQTMLADAAKGIQGPRDEGRAHGPAVDRTLILAGGARWLPGPLHVTRKQQGGGEEHVRGVWVLWRWPVQRRAEALGLCGPWQ